MAINATIQVRRGLLKDFDPTKMLPGEWAVSIDSSTSNQIVWMCFAPGVCKRMGTYEDFQNMIYNATGEIIERYEDAFGSILEEVNTNAEAVSANTDIVLVAKSDIINTYLPQIKSYVSNASASASEAKTYSENAKASASEADKSAEDAKKYSQNAFSTTPEGYEALVGDVDVLKNSIIQTTGRTLYGSKEGGIKLVGIKGASEQGENPSPDNPQEIESVGDLKNLLDLSGLIESVSNGITFTPIFKSGLLQYILVNGTATAQARYYFPSDLVFSYDTILSIKGATNGGVSGYASGGNVFAEEKTMTAGTSYATFFLFVNSGVTVENVKIYPMIRKASVKNSEYKPYGYSLEIKEKGKNLAHENYIKLYASNDTKLVAQSTGIMSLLIKVKPNTTYLLGRNGGTSHGTIGYLKDVPKVGDSVKVTYLGSSAKRSITTLEDTNYILWYNGTSSAMPTEVFCYETTDTTADYEPYRSKSITIPLNEPLRGIGEVKDEVVCQDGVWGVLRWIYKKVLDGTAVAQGFTNIGTVNRVFFTIGSEIVGASTTTNFLITSFQKVADYTFDKEHCYLSNGDLFVFINADRLTSQDASGVSAWLADNDVECNFIRATPTFEPFTDQTPFYGLESFDTVTYISTDSEVEPSIELKFAKTEGDAVTLLNYNQTNLNRIAIAELTSAVLALNQE